MDPMAGQPMPQDMGMPQDVGGLPPGMEQLPMGMQQGMGMPQDMGMQQGMPMEEHQYAIEDLQRTVAQLQEELQGRSEALSGVADQLAQQVSDQINAIRRQMVGVEIESLTATREIEELKAQHNEDISQLQEESCNMHNMAKQDNEKVVLEAVSSVADEVRKTSEDAKKRISNVIEMVSAVEKATKEKKPVQVIYENGKAVRLSDGRVIEYDDKGNIKGIK